MSDNPLAKSLSRQYEIGTLLVDRRLMSNFMYDSGEDAMAERKSALRRAPARPDLMQSLERAKATDISDAQLQEQRASFAYGNAPQNSRITKASATNATKRIRLSETTP